MLHNIPILTFECIFQLELRGTRATVDIDKCTFGNNAAAGGGGISCNGKYDSDAEIRIHNSVFYLNKALKSGGGGLTSQKLSYISMESTTFVGNNAEKGGGGYHSVVSNFWLLERYIFSANSHQFVY